ncbi:YfhO family protein [Streptomyces sp. NPDC059680]|uniref:YfhO family protein n=1 Tax=Streptomyces sp. NPDC059680 TaxID=3346904 RepID=UPI00369380E4
MQQGGKPISRPRRAAALPAEAVAVTAFCAGDLLARSYPFGPRTRSVNDLGNQYVPFHAHLWDLLHGHADGGVLVNWQSGYGSSFLPDLGTYLGSPFAATTRSSPGAAAPASVSPGPSPRACTTGSSTAWSTSNSWTASATSVCCRAAWWTPCRPSPSTTVSPRASSPGWVSRAPPSSTRTPRAGPATARGTCAACSTTASTGCWLSTTARCVPPSGSAWDCCSARACARPGSWERR